MNSEMIYKMFLNSVKNMNEDELKNMLQKIKPMLSESDYKKFEDGIAKRNLDEK